MSTIDLHGYTYEEAVVVAEDALLEASFDIAMTFEIITGKSKKMQDLIISEVVEKHGFRWNIPLYNTGIIIVTN